MCLEALRGQILMSFLGRAYTTACKHLLGPALLKSQAFLYAMKFPPYAAEVQAEVAKTYDPVRFGTIALALERVREIPGSLAEVGVWQGTVSRFIHRFLPDRTYYLFDTFEGFPESDLTHKDQRFRDTSVDRVKKTIGDTTNVIFRVGYFPRTAMGLENEQFAFVMIDVDLYTPTLAALEFFYPRLVPGGYVFVHDYNSPESEWGVSRAVNLFMRDKPEPVVEIPDKFGTVIFRRCFADSTI